MVTLQHILDYQEDFKICHHCTTINAKDNDTCFSCGSNVFPPASHDFFVNKVDDILRQQNNRPETYHYTYIDILLPVSEHKD